jgi:hypothetical protein
MMRRLLFILFSIGIAVNAQYTIINPYEGVDFDTYHKSNLHMHTKESDGDQTVAERLMTGGDSDGGYIDSLYTILSITDHDSYEADPYLGQFSGVGSTWPWNDYTGLTGYSPSAWNITVDTSSAYYLDMGGVLAVRGNELTACEDDYYTHINSYFSNLGYAACPADDFTGYFDDIDSVGGLAVFNHPGRHEAPSSFYVDFFKTYTDSVLLGIEIHNAGDYRPVQNPRVLWDSINMSLSYDSLIWGFSNTDVHQAAFSEDEWKNFNIHYLDTLSETGFRENLQSGAFTAVWAGYFDDFVDPDQDAADTVALLTNVTVNGSEITLTASNCDSVRWFDKNHDSILTAYTIDVADYDDVTHYVRAELYKDGWITYTQPFGFESDGDVGGDYYVSPSGNDSDAGTYDAPWKTPQKAIETADAGDTVYFMGGTYYPTVHTPEVTGNVYYWSPGDSYGNSGTYENPICFYNYPSESPVIDFTNMDTVNGGITGLYMDSVHHVRFRGLTFQNIPKGKSGPNVMGIDAYGCSYLHFDRMVFQYNGGAAIRHFSGIDADLGIATDSSYVINCDFFYNVDTAGNHADGLKWDQAKGAYFYFEGNRSFFNSDDGFDISGSALRIFYNNWAVGTGWVAGGNGNGIKTGALRDTVDFSTVIMYKNISAYNHSEDDNSGAGFDIVDNQVSDTSYHRANARFYNNISYHNDIGFMELNNPLWDFRNCVYRNNIAYGSTYEQDDVPFNVSIITYLYPESHNTWDVVSGGYSFVETDTVTMTDADWLTVDSATIVSQMMAARQSDGSLPVLTTAFVLSPTSDLINMGTTTGWSEFADFPGVPAQSTSGSAPDIGAYEYAVESSKNITSFKTSKQRTTEVIDTTAHTVTLIVGGTKTSIAPTIIHTGASIDPASGVAQDFTSPVTYTITADDASTQEWTVTVTTRNKVTSGGNRVKVGSNYIYIDN